MKKIAYLLSVYAIVMFSGCKGPDSDSNRPNIIFILADDLGYGDISAFNSEGKINTPYVDQLAEEGMMFTDAHTSSAVCTPTRYGVLNGRYNFRSRLKRGVLYGMSKGLIDTARTTMASMLQEQGYHTAYIGKWHLGWNWQMKENKEGGDKGISEFQRIDYTKPIEHSPNDVGFDYAYGHVASLDMPPYVYVENEYATSVPDRIVEETDRMAFYRKGPAGADFIMDQVTPHFFHKAMDYVAERSIKKEPFFLYLPLPSPHTPILPTEEWQGRSSLNPYADFVMMVDDYVGQLMKKLDDEGLSENTILIFSSDNGCSPRADFDDLASKGHDPSYIFRGHKADLFEGGHRVPFVVRWPGVVKPGSICKKTICQVDLMATFADLTGYTLPEDGAEDSFSFLSLLTDPASETYERVSLVSHSIDGSFAIRKGPWKLLLCSYSGGWSFPRKRDLATIDPLPPVQLYHLENDPGETNNLYAKYPEKVEELKSEMIRIYLEGRSTEGPAQKNDPPRRENWEEPWFITELANE